MSEESYWSKLPESLRRQIAEESRWPTPEEWEAIREGAERMFAQLPEPRKIPADFWQRTTGDVRAALRGAYQRAGFDVDEEGKPQPS